MRPIERRIEKRISQCCDSFFRNQERAYVFTTVCLISDIKMCRKNSVAFLE